MKEELDAAADDDGVTAEEEESEEGEPEDEEPEDDKATELLLSPMLDECELLICDVTADALEEPDSTTADEDGLLTTLPFPLVQYLSAPHRHPGAQSAGELQG